MCGIAGILGINGRPPERERLVRMSRALAHRGPDGWGIEISGACGLAHRRLSIIDLSVLARQPMSSADGRLLITYNGEVYNYLELRSDLEGLGFRFRSESDTEVILNAYRAWGLDAFPRMNGMWGLAIYEVDERRLVLARDRLGIKPLYFHKSNDELLFASETKALLAAEPRLQRLDQTALARFLEWGVVGHGRPTLFENVERVQPATVLTIDADGRTSEHRYWSFRPPVQPLRVSADEAAARVREILTSSVRFRFRSDVPVGTCLSGGLDSSSIVALAKLRIGKAPETFSVIYDDPEFSETAHVRTMARELSLPGNEIAPDGRDLCDVLHRCTYYQEEPTAGPGLYSQWHVMAIAAPKVKVLLDGQGGDELFGGYYMYFAPYMQGLVNRALRGEIASLPEIVRADREIRALTGDGPARSMIRRARKRWQTRILRAVRSRFGDDTAVRGALRGLRRGLMRSPSGGAPLSFGPLAEPALSSLVDEERAGWAPIEVVTGDPLRDALWDSLVRTSIPGLLHYEDRNSMAFSIEARVPFLDYRLVEYAFQLPAEHLIRGGSTKAVLRDAMRSILPESIRTRTDKKGYPTPFSRWLSEPRHREWLEDLLFSRRARDRGFVRHEASRGMFDEHLSGRRDHSWVLWRLVTLEIFLRRYFDGIFAAEAPPRHAVLEDSVDPSSVLSRSRLEAGGS